MAAASRVVSGPVWDREQLVAAAAMRWGKTRYSRPRADRMAKALGVSTRTVQRWFKGSSEELVLPAGRLDEILRLLRPSEETLEEERRQRIYAEDSLRELNLPPRRVRPEYTWIRDGWLQPHFVSIVRIKGWPEARRVILSADTESARRRLNASGLMDDMRLVANRFVGSALKIDVLQVMDPWRVVLTKSQLDKGGTQAWLSLAPVPDLSLFPVLPYRYSKIGQRDL